MSTSNSAQERQAILNAISKHPNTKFAKLFREVDDSPSQKNIVLLLIELTQQKEFYVDFNISLQYFLNLYEELDAANREFLFNEAGLLIINATQIYSRRIDCLQQRLEDQLAELSKGQESQEKSSTNEKNAEPEKPRRRKRLVETQDIYDIEIVSRKFRKLNSEKRFAESTKLDLSKIFLSSLHAENYTHPALWQHSEIVDLENDELESKKNYRLFSSHIEHRYNTLMSDMNFPLYYKMKDFMTEKDENNDDDEMMSDWPPLSHAYLTRYLKVEEQALMQNSRIDDTFKPLLSSHQTLLTLNCNNESNTMEECIDEINTGDDVTNQISNANHMSIDLQSQNDSGIGTSLLEDSSNSLTEQNNINGSTRLQADDENKTEIDTVQMESSGNCEEGAAPTTENHKSTNETDFENTKEDVSNIKTQEGFDDNSIESKPLQDDNENKIEIEAIDSKSNQLENNSNPYIENNEEKAPTIDERSTNNTNSEINNEEVSNTNTTKADLNENPTNGETKEDAEKTLEIIVHIEKENDGCVSSDLSARHSSTNDEGVCLSDIDDSPLTPVTIHLNLRTTTNEGEESAENAQKTYQLPDEMIKLPTEWPIDINILQFPKELLKKMRRKVLFTLGAEMELFLKARSYKRTRVEKGAAPRQFKAPSQNVSASSSPCPDDSNLEDLLGFTEDGNIVIQSSNREISNILLSPKTDHRLSRDSGVGYDILTASPEKNPRFFAPFSEEASDGVQNQISTKDEEKEFELFDVFTSDDVEPATEEEETKVAEPSSVEDQIANETKTDEPNSERRDQEDEETNIDEQNSENVQLAVENPFRNSSWGKNFMSELEATSVTESAAVVEDADDDIVEHIELSEDITTKIQKWHKHLQPILAKSSQRHHFDVFQIGTEIIDGFQISDKLTFQDVMEDKDPSYVSRYFLSTLLLANQGNLDLNVSNKSDSSPSEWHDVNLRLLSTTRHVVSMEDNIGLLPKPAINKTKPEVIKLKSTKRPLDSLEKISKVKMIRR